MEEFRMADKFTDIKVICQDQAYECHRLILAAASEYFDRMLSGNFKESKLEESKLNEIHSATFEEILRFAYTKAMST